MSNGPGHFDGAALQFHEDGKLMINNCCSSPGPVLRCDPVERLLNAPPLMRRLPHCCSSCSTSLLDYLSAKHTCRFCCCLYVSWSIKLYDFLSVNKVPPPSQMELPASSQCNEGMKVSSQTLDRTEYLFSSGLLVLAELTLIQCGYENSEERSVSGPCIAEADRGTHTTTR